jgi:hypothetical protein
MRRLYAKAAKITTETSALSTITDLSRRRMIYTGKDGKPRLDPNLEPLLWILNSPDQVFSMARLAAPDMAECYFCSSGTLWVQEAVNFDERVELLLYPFNWDDIAVFRRLLGDLAPASLRRRRLLIPELLLLLALQCEYGRGYRRRRPPRAKGPLDRADQPSQEAALQEMLPWPPSTCPSASAPTGDRTVGKVADGLAKRSTDSRAVPCAGTDARGWFNPGRRQAVVTTRAFGPELVRCSARIRQVPLSRHLPGCVRTQVATGDDFWRSSPSSWRARNPAPGVKNPPR